MGKPILTSGANAVRTLLKYKEDFQFDLRSETMDGTATTRVYDIFYENTTGTFTIVTDHDEISVAALNLSMGKVINLHNDQNLRKLARYVLEHTR